MQLERDGGAGNTFNSTLLRLLAAIRISPDAARIRPRFLLFAYTPSRNFSRLLVTSPRDIRIFVRQSEIVSIERYVASINKLPNNSSRNDIVKVTLLRQDTRTARVINSCYHVATSTDSLISFGRS